MQSTHTPAYLALELPTGAPAGRDHYTIVIGPFDDVESARGHQAHYGPADAKVVTTDRPEADEWSTPAQHARATSARV